MQLESKVIDRDHASHRVALLNRRFLICLAGYLILSTPVSGPVNIPTAARVKLQQGTAIAKVLDVLSHSRQRFIIRGGNGGFALSVSIYFSFHCC